MKLTSAHLLLAGAVELCGALPHYDSPQQRLAKGLSLTGKYAKDNPYTPDHSDPHDHAIDAIGKGLDPRPWRNGDGATVLGPYNRDRSRQSPDMIRPPSTDHGNIPNMRWSYTDSHVRIEEGGWTRQTTVRELPTSIELAGVNMRLDTGVIRELHWHKEAEWAYVLEGEVRVTALDYEGGNFMDDLKKGDLWYFPSGVPHSLQGLGENGTEFLLIFDDGRFSEESTFILTDWLAHTPKSVIAKNFRLDPQVFAHLPAGEKYIFQGSQPGAIDQERPSGKHVKKSQYQFTHRMLDQEPKQTSGGLVRITDSTNFPIAQTVAAAHVIIEPGALREMHWHPTADEWSFFIRGRARVTVFAAEGNARTFDYVPGDVGIVPKNMGHFVENIGDEPVEMLEVFRADKFRDFSLFQWMGETPRRMVVDHLFAGDEDNGRKFWEARNMSRLGANGDTPARNAGETADPVEAANAKPDDVFVKDYVPLLPCEWTHPVSKTRYAITLLQAARLTEAQVDKCFGIVDQTSGRDYRLSLQGWHPSAKKEEMRSPDLRYILVRRGEEICGFTSLMPTWENGEPVVYCYEIHLTEEVKGTGLGSQLMGYLTEVAERAEGIDKVMLTCFVRNERARRFYERLGFDVDENSPRERRLRGKLIAADYVIMSRRVKRGRRKKPVAGGDG